MNPPMSWYRVWGIIFAIRLKKVVCTAGRLASLQGEIRRADPVKVSVLKRELSDLLNDEQRRFLFGNGAE